MYPPVLSTNHLLLTTLIRFCVRVPVLSEQMTLTQPSDSTVLSDLQSTFFFFIELALRAIASNQRRCFGPSFAQRSEARLT